MPDIFCLSNEHVNQCLFIVQLLIAKRLHVQQMRTVCLFVCFILQGRLQSTHKDCKIKQTPHFGIEHQACRPGFIDLYHSSSVIILLEITLRPKLIFF